MLQSPKKRIWPFPSLRSCSNIRRQPAGEISGNNPSMTSSRASASQRLLPFTALIFWPVPVHRRQNHQSYQNLAWP